MDEAIVIRGDGPGDREAVRTVAERDSRRPPRGELLVAERGGVVRAYICLEVDDQAGDPFHPTADLLELLQLRAAQLDRRDGGTGGLWYRIRESIAAIRARPRLLPVLRSPASEPR